MDLGSLKRDAEEIVGQFLSGEKFDLVYTEVVLLCLQQMQKVTGRNEAAEIEEEIHKYLADLDVAKTNLGNTVESVLNAPAKYSLYSVLQELKYSRPAEQQKFIDEICRDERVIGKKFTLLYTDSFMTGSHLQTIPATIQVSVDSEEQLRSLIKDKYPSTYRVFEGWVETYTEW